MSPTATKPKPKVKLAAQPKAQEASREAKRLAAAILEVLAGLRTPTDAAQSLSISVPRYYILEQRALDGLVLACEPRTQGRQQTPERRAEELEKEVQRLTREVARQHALVRVTGRTIGLPAPQPAKPATKGKPAAGGKSPKRRKRKPAVRALRAARQLGDSLAERSPPEVHLPAMARPGANGASGGKESAK